MTNATSTGQHSAPVGKLIATDEYVLERYESAIDYYWKASRANKRFYKWTRILAVIFGAFVTLMSSLSSSEFVRATESVDLVFAIATPVLAALLAIIGGFSQSFQFGAAWQEMVLTAEELEAGRDRFVCTAKEDRNLLNEIESLNQLLLNESRGFFQRILGTTAPTKDTKGR